MVASASTFALLAASLPAAFAWGGAGAVTAPDNVELTLRFSTGNPCAAGRFEKVSNIYAPLLWLPDQDVTITADTEGVGFGLEIFVTAINGKAVDSLAWAGHPASLQYDSFRDVMGENLSQIVAGSAGFAREDFPDFADSETDNFRGEFWENLPSRRDAGTACKDTCKDDPWFSDEQYVTCLEWDGLDCYGAVRDWGYSKGGMADVLINCCKTCTANAGGSTTSTTTSTWGQGSKSSTPPAANTAASTANTNPIPSSKELSDIAAAYAKLWELDDRLVADQDYSINPQRYTSSSRTSDEASRPLFDSVSSSVFQRPTFKTFMKLMDNYEAKAGVTETVSSTEASENKAFLDAALKEPVMKYVYNYLKQKGTVSSESAFRTKLNDLWFKLFRRKGYNDSSGFEHVFVGEANSDKISGMHNWLQLYTEEKADRLDYQGYIRNRDRSNSYSDDQLITIQFLWNGQRKPISSSLIGVTPEFELALYTLCYFASPDPKTDVRLGDYNVKVVCYKNGYGSDEHLGSAWVEAN